MRRLHVLALAIVVPVVAGAQAASQDKSQPRRVFTERRRIRHCRYQSADAALSSARASDIAPSSQKREEDGCINTVGMGTMSRR